MTDPLDDDRALALRYLRPRQVTPPPYAELTDSGRAEVDRIVALIDHVRSATLAGAAARTADMTHCFTCGQALLDCGQPWPPSLSDVRPVRCRLPRGHRSEEHWHPALWTGTADLLWFADEEVTP